MFIFIIESKVVVFLAVEKRTRLSKQTRLLQFHIVSILIGRKLSRNIFQSMSKKVLSFKNHNSNVVGDFILFLIYVCFFLTVVEYEN